MKKLFLKIKTWYTSQDYTVRAFLWIALICIIGIALRWDAVTEGIRRGFEFYSPGGETNGR